MTNVVCRTRLSEGPDTRLRHEGGVGFHGYLRIFTVTTRFLEGYTLRLFLQNAMRFIYLFTRKKLVVFNRRVHLIVVCV